MPPIFSAVPFSIFVSFCTQYNCLYIVCTLHSNTLQNVTVVCGLLEVSLVFTP